MAHVFLIPLSWGLGHATRDIPIIRKLKDHGHEVTIATRRSSFHLLKKDAGGSEAPD
ncbi:MAG TPA: hypothetical protein VF354_06720 [Candidatus Methanoperedens sp.]